MEKIKALLCCNKQKPYLALMENSFDDDYINMYGLSHSKEILNNSALSDIFNGKICCECDFEVEEIRGEIITGICGWISPSKYDWCYDKDLLDKSCLTNDMLCDYLDGNTGYAIHIKNLNIFNKPRELSDYCLYPKNIKGIIHFVLEDTPYILLSVSPEEMCRILNKKQTILVKKRVLKGIL